MNIFKPGKSQKISERWKLQYNCQHGWRSVYSKLGPQSSKDIYDKIVAIEQSRTKKKLDKIDETIGSKGWTRGYCSGCSTQTRDNMVSVEVSGGEYACKFCITCVKKMLHLLENTK